MQKVSLIDMGSSTVKLSIYNKETGELLHKSAQTVNMAENFYPNKSISNEAIERVVNALKKFEEELNSANIKNIKLVTTGIARKAENIDELQVAIKKSLGWDLEVIPAEQEAEIFYKGVCHDFKENLNMVAINIGGGSTEIAFGTHKEIYRRLSFPVGVTDINETFLTEDPPSNESISKMFDYLEKVICLELPENITPSFLIHTGGELDYMLATGHPLEESNFSPTHPKHITLDKFKSKYNEIKSKTKNELYAHMPHNPKWMEGAVACTAIAITIAEKLNINLIVPSNKNLNDGLLLKLIGKEGI